MEITYDIAKSERNIKERGLSFDRVASFDWTSALVSEDVRNDYPERRFVAFGLIDNRLHALCFTPTANGIRVISFRKANQREVKKYAEQTTN